MFTFEMNIFIMEHFFHRVIKKSADGSHTLFLPHWQEHYHSMHGALGESVHVFIREGLDRWLGGRGTHCGATGREGTFPAPLQGPFDLPDREVSPDLDGLPGPFDLPDQLELPDPGGRQGLCAQPDREVSPDLDGPTDRSGLRILEIGFGTGLNALLSLARIMECGLCADYLALEPYPLRKGEYTRLNIPELVAGGAYAGAYLEMHEASCTGHPITLEDRFRFRLLPLRLEETELPTDHFDLVYHDAFAPQFQPSLWDEAAFARLYRAMREGALLTTYSAKGSVKRAMRAVGYRVEHPPGPAGKRQMSRAIKDPG